MNRAELVEILASMNDLSKTATNTHRCSFRSGAGSGRLCGLTGSEAFRAVKIEQALSLLFVPQHRAGLAQRFTPIDTGQWSLRWRTLSFVMGLPSLSM